MRKDPGRLPPLELLTAFEAAARHLSFTKAAAERFRTQSAISRQIKALEDDLGAALFHRRHRALELTDDGRQLADATRAALADLRRTVARIRSPRRRDVIALTTTPGLASLWLIPRLADFLRAHPDVDVRIDTSLARRDLDADGFDCALRYAIVGATEGTPLFREATLPVCSPRLAKSRARPLKTPADLRHHTLLQVEVPPGASVPLEWQPWLLAVGLGDLEPAAMLSFSSYDSAIAAALAGQGVALGRRPLVDELLRARKLVAPFRSDPIASERAYFLVIAPGARNRPAMQALEQWLIAQAQPRRDSAAR
jgi:DNA-binding transcriptional LysR family regulator